MAVPRWVVRLLASPIVSASPLMLAALSCFSPEAEFREEDAARQPASNEPSPDREKHLRDSGA